MICVLKVNEYESYRNYLRNRIACRSGLPKNFALRITILATALLMRMIKTLAYEKWAALTGSKACMVTSAQKNRRGDQKRKYVKKIT